MAFLLRGALVVLVYLCATVHAERIDDVSPAQMRGGDNILIIGLFEGTCSTLLIDGLPFSSWAPPSSALLSCTVPASVQHGNFALIYLATDTTVAFNVTLLPTLLSSTRDGVAGPVTLTLRTAMPGLVCSSFTLLGQPFGGIAVHTNTQVSGCSPAISIPCGTIGSVQVVGEGSVGAPTMRVPCGLVTVDTVATGFPGDGLILSGTGLQNVLCEQVLLGGISAAGNATASANGRTLYGCSIPEDSAVGNMSVVVAMPLAGSATRYLSVRPALHSVSPDSGSTSTTLTIRGIGLRDASCADFFMEPFGTDSVAPLIGFATVAWVDGEHVVSGCLPAPYSRAGATAVVTAVLGGVRSTDDVYFTYMPALFRVEPRIVNCASPVTIVGSGLGDVLCHEVTLTSGAVTSALNGENVALDSGTRLTGCTMPCDFSIGDTASLSVRVNGIRVTLAAGFTVSPLVAGMVPSSGVGGDLVVVYGAFLSGVASCTDLAINFVTLVGDSVVNDTVITGCRVPVLPTGTRAPLVVTVMGVPSNENHVFSFIPRINTLYPVAGPPGTWLRVAGDGFAGPSVRVTIDGVECADALREGPTISCVTPTLPIGLAADVIVMVGSTSSEARSFRYVPGVDEVKPRAGDRRSILTVYGGGFGSAGAVAVTVGGLPCVPSPALIVSDGAIEGCGIPAEISYGAHAVLVSVDGTSSLPVPEGEEDFFLGAVVDSVAPSAGAVNSSITIRGGGFDAPGLLVRVGFLICRITFVNISTVACSFQAPAVDVGTMKEVAVSAMGVDAGGLSFNFTLTVAPAVIDMVPNRGLASGGDDVFLFSSPSQPFMDLPFLTIRLGGGDLPWVDVHAHNISFLSNTLVRLVTPEYPTSAVVPVSASNDGWSFGPTEDMSFTFFSGPHHFALVRPLPPVYANMGFADSDVPLIHIVDKEGVRVRSPYGDGIVVTITVSGAIEASGLIGNVKDANDGLVSFTGFGFTGGWSTTYSYTISAPDMLTMVVANGTTVAACRLNSLPDLETGLTCECMPGFALTSSYCSPCAVGFYKSEQGNNPCTSCPSDKTTMHPGARELIECVCVASLYVAGVEDGAYICKLCPEGGTCRDGMIAPKEGFWHSSPNSPILHQCPMMDACGAGGECQEGYQGVLCAACSNNYVPSARRCVRCIGSMWINVFILLSVYMMFALFAWFLVSTNLKKWKAKKSTTTAQSLKMLVTFCQLVGFVGRFSINWPGAVSTLFSIFNILNSTTEFYSSQCVLKMSFFENTALSMLTPFIILLLPFLIVVFELFMRMLCGIRAAHHTWEEQYQKFFVAVIALNFVVHPGITAKVLTVFACKEVDGINYLAADISVVCNEGTHAVWRNVAIVYLLGYCVGLPALAVAALTYHRHQLDDPTIRRLYGFLYIGFRPQMFFWEVVVLCRKFCISAIKALLHARPYAQIYSALSVIGLSLAIDMYMKPFTNPFLTNLDFLGMFVTFLFLVAALAFQSGDVTLLTDRGAATPGNSIITVMLFSISLVTVALHVYGMRGDIKSIYWWFAMKCCGKEKAAGSEAAHFEPPPFHPVEGPLPNTFSIATQTIAEVKAFRSMTPAFVRRMTSSNNSRSPLGGSMGGSLGGSLGASCLQMEEEKEPTRSIESVATRRYQHQGLLFPHPSGAHVHGDDELTSDLDDVLLEDVSREEGSSEGSAGGREGSVVEDEDASDDVGDASSNDTECCNPSDDGQEGSCARCDVEEEEEVALREGSPVSVDNRSWEVTEGPRWVRKDESAMEASPQVPRLASPAPIPAAATTTASAPAEGAPGGPTVAAQDPPVVSKVTQKRIDSLAGRIDDLHSLVQHMRMTDADVIKQINTPPDLPPAGGTPPHPARHVRAGRPAAQARPGGARSNQRPTSRSRRP